MRYGFSKVMLLVGFLVCCTLACNIADELYGPSEDQIDQDKAQREYEQGWRITETYLHTTPEFIWSEKPKKTVDFETTLTQQVISKECYWNRNEAASTEGGNFGLDQPKGATAVRNGDTIVLTYPHSGAFGCPEQVLQTTHRWTPTIPVKFKPGEKIVFSVSAEWSLMGSRECSTLMAGVSSEIKAEKTSIRASRSGIIISKEPSGSIQHSATWSVPGHSFSGDKFKLSILGTTGGVGYSINYEYQYICYQTE